MHKVDPTMRFGRILIAIDFSEEAREALEAATDLAIDKGAELTLIHVLQPLAFGFAFEGAMPTTYTEDVIRDAERGLLDWQRQAETRGAKRVSSLVRIGTPWNEVVELARKERFDVIVVGTHGRTGLRHIMLGSVAEKVMRHASCAVIIARKPRPDL